MLQSTSKQNGTSERVGEFVTMYLRGKTWWARYQSEGRQQRESLLTRNRKEARRKASIIDADLLRGLHQLALPPVSIDRAVVLFMESLELKENASKTVRDYRRVLDQVSDFAKSQNRPKLHQLDLQFVDAYRKFRKESRTPEIKPKTIAKEVAILRSLMLFTLSRSMIRDDPLLELKNPKPKPTPQPVWTPEELERILNAAEEPHSSMYTMLADTGMRIGELAWLTWDDVDSERRVIQIRPKQKWKPKSGEARTVPMSMRVRELLISREREFQWVFTARRSPQYPEGGNRISERRLLRSLKRLLKRIGFSEKGKLHTFRHSFISKSLACGVPQTLVRQWVEHVSQATMDLYTHELAAQSQAAMQEFSRIAEGLRFSTFVAQSDPGEKK